MQSRAFASVRVLKIPNTGILNIFTTNKKKEDEKIPHV